MRQDETADQPDVVGHGEDEEVDGQVDEEDRVEDAVDGRVGQEEPVDGGARTFFASTVQNSEKTDLKNDRILTVQFWKMKV